MDVLEAVMDLVFSQTGWLAIIAGCALFIFLGRARLPTMLAGLLALSISFAYVVSITRETGITDTGDVLLLRVIGALIYAVYLVVAHWIGRTMLRPAAKRIARIRRWFGYVRPLDF